MTKMWLIPVLFLGGEGTGIFAEKKANEPPTRTKALVIEGTDGLHLRMEVSIDPPRTMTIRGLAGGRVRMEWDDKLAIKSRSFVMSVPVDEHKGQSGKTTFESGGEESVKMTIDRQGINAGNAMTVTSASFSFQFDSLVVTVRR